MDSVEWLTLAIMDKGYYDYDYQYIEPRQEIRLVEDTAKSDEEIAKRLARFGIGRKQGAEVLQRAVIKDLKERKGE